MSSFGRDVAGSPYATRSDASPQALSARDPISSRTTEEEARDLLALQRAKRGDDRAFAELISANDDDVRALVCALAGPEELDPFCLQIYLRAYRGLPVAPNTSPRLWLLGIADGTLRDILRRRNGKTESPIATNLPGDHRLVCAALFAVGLTPREAARLASVDPTTIDAIVATARDSHGLSEPFPQAAAHDSAFWDELGRKLMIERGAPAVPAPKPEEITGRQPVAMSVPTSARSRGAAKGMAKRVTEIHPREFPWHVVWTALGIVTFVLVVVGITLSLAHRATNHDAGLGDTATKVLNQFDRALANDVAISGTVIIQSTNNQRLRSGRYTFVRTNIGSWNIRSKDGVIEQGYDVARASYIALHRTLNGEVSSAESATGLAPGPPAMTANADDSLGDVLAESVRVVRGGTNGSAESVTPTTLKPSDTEATPQWVITSDLSADAPEQFPLAGTGALLRLHADSVTLVADQSLSLPTRVTLRKQGRTIATVRFVGLSIAQQAPVSPLTPTLPANAMPTRSVGGFTFTELGRLNTGGDGRIPTPSYLPSGYVLASVGVNKTSRTTVLCYRNGSRQLVLTFRPRPLGVPADPFGSSSESSSKPQTFSISSGRFAGTKATGSLDPIAHIWTQNSATQVIVAGDPNIDTLTKVIASLN